jgi:site-specific DNA recombinase
MPAVAIYARFSSDRQRETSADDQVRICRERAEREGWSIAGVYTDLAISGANNRRPGMTGMLADAAAGTFDIVLAEALDRIARDQEDIAGFYKRLKFAGVRLITLTEGEVSELHIGLKGTMDALELQKLGDKIRRGAQGAIGRGFVPAGLSYGYAIAPELRPDGTVLRGRRLIIDEQAEVVRRIFASFLAGASPRAIAKQLNAEGIPSPRGSEWRATTITGTRSRQNGILRNPIYDGRYVYGRVRMLRDPETRNRVSRVAAADRRIEAQIEALRIVDHATWTKAQVLIGANGDMPLHQRPRARKLLSGLVRCGVCGGNYAVIASARWGCTRHREAGTCPNGRRIGTEELETRVLDVLKHKLLAPEAVAHMVREFHLERTRLNKESSRARATMERRLAALKTSIERLVLAMADGDVDVPEFRQALQTRRDERDRLEQDLAELDTMPVIALHPQIAEAYRKQIASLQLTVGGDGDTELATRVRALIQVITITPGESSWSDVNVLTSLQAAVEMAQNRHPTARKGAPRMLQMVAGEGLEPPTPGL